jgi:hypothetical protein
MSARYNISDVCSYRSGLKEREQMQTFHEGDIIRDPSGHLRFRAREDRVAFGDGEAETTPSPPLGDLTKVHIMTDVEAWDVFDQAARRYLDIGGDEFLRRWDAGDYPDPDAQEGLMSVVMLIPLVRPGVASE